jgi:hypothetical protein
MAIDKTFRIRAEHHRTIDQWQVLIFGMGELYFSDSEWTAFKSLLQPSAKADFKITEIDPRIKED